MNPTPPFTSRVVVVEFVPIPTLPFVFTSKKRNPFVFATQNGWFVLPVEYVADNVFAEMLVANPKLLETKLFLAKFVAL